MFLANMPDVQKQMQQAENLYHDPPEVTVDGTVYPVPKSQPLWSTAKADDPPHNSELWTLQLADLGHGIC